MNTLIFLGIAALVIGGTYAVPALLRRRRERRKTTIDFSACMRRAMLEMDERRKRKPDNKDLFQK